jgi:hypothetical protein
MGRRKLTPNLGRGWVESDALVRMRHTAGARAAASRVRSDAFGRNALARWRCPNLAATGVSIYPAVLLSIPGGQWTAWPVDSGGGLAPLCSSFLYRAPWICIFFSLPTSFAIPLEIILGETF